jgi:hypothetical protein
MPIKPENLARYPADWPEIRERILRRALWRCEHPGCKALHRDVGWWRDGKFVHMNRALRDAGAKAGDTIACSDGSTIKLIMIVLTIAHLDHQPENCADDNLRAWCQRHHLAYDAEQHKASAYRTRKDKAQTMEMF